MSVHDLTTKSKVMREAGLRPGMNASGKDLSQLDLSGVDLHDVNFNRASLASTNLAGAILNGASLVCPVIERTTMRNASALGVYAHAMAAVSSDWSGIRFQSPDCTGALFHGVKLVDADLSGSNFAGTTFYQCDLSGAILTDTVLDHAVFNECVMDGTAFARAKMEGCLISRSSVRRLNLSGAIAPGLKVSRSTGQSVGWNFTGAHLRGASFDETAFFRCRFDGADLERARFLGCALGETVFSTANLRSARFDSVIGNVVQFADTDLSGASLAHVITLNAGFDGAKMENTFVLECDMPGSGLRAIKGRGLTFRDCNLAESTFRDAYLYRAVFTGDPVTGMILDRCDFTGANLIQATIAASAREAILRNARAAYARLNQTDLTGAMLDGFKAYKASTVKTVWPDGKAPADVLVAPDSSELGST